MIKVIFTAFSPRRSRTEEAFARSSNHSNRRRSSAGSWEIYFLKTDVQAMQTNRLIEKYLNFVSKYILNGVPIIYKSS